MGRKSIETLVGLFVVLGMVAMVFLALKAANLGSFSGGETYTVKARFDNIGGLKPRAPVRSAGVKVGTVTKIGLVVEVLDASKQAGALKLAIMKSAEGGS